MGCGQYKEEYRADMIRWGEMKRRQDSGFFCRLAIRHAARPVWVHERSEHTRDPVFHSNAALPVSCRSSVTAGGGRTCSGSVRSFPISVCVFGWRRRSRPDLRGAGDSPQVNEAHYNRHERSEDDLMLCSVQVWTTPSPSADWTRV